MASLKAEKPAVGSTQHVVQAKKDPKGSVAAPKTSAPKSLSGSKKAAQKSQEAPKKGKGSKSATKH